MCITVNPNGMVILQSAYWLVPTLVLSINNIDTMINTPDLVIDEWEVSRLTNGLLNHYYSISDYWTVESEQHRFNNRTDFLVQKVNKVDGTFMDHIFVENP